MPDVVVAEVRHLECGCEVVIGWSRGNPEDGVTVVDMVGQLDRICSTHAAELGDD